jgi:hypothetical protein
MLSLVSSFLSLPWWSCNNVMKRNKSKMMSTTVSSKILV